MEKTIVVETEKNADEAYKNLALQFDLVTQQIKSLKEQQDDIKDALKDMLEHDEIEEKVIVVSDKQSFKLAWGERSSKSVDYETLFETVGASDYSKIVKTKESVFFTVRGVKTKKDDKKKTKVKSNRKTSGLQIPMGNLV